MAACGTRSGYVAGCRCARCTKAQRDYMREYQAARRAGVTGQDRCDAAST